METITLKQLCEQILLSESLEDKLIFPADVVLNEYEARRHIPDFPGRPPELKFNSQKAIKLPSVHSLEQEKNRGILLHFFLNHELLALEIMALTLLKFPQLPDSFQRGLLQSMKEEQSHAKLYLKRMSDLGVEPGDGHVNSFFWDCLKSISTPGQYIKSMSLTFEQANLDFALFYKNAFARCGDHTTASIMHKVYNDEIRHVSFGLKWLRKWKKKDLTEWQDYVSGLEFPLSPARAKGPFVDLVGRRKVGFDQDFIDHLQVTSFSRGRAPEIYIFNAFTESSIVKPQGFNRPKWGLQLEEDLAILPLVFCKQDDLLYTCRSVSVGHLKKLKNCGFELPQIITVKAGEPLKKLSERRPGGLHPWGWSPEMNRLLEPLIKQRQPAMVWHKKCQRFFSKQWSSELNKVVNASHFSRHEQEETLGVFCETIDDIRQRCRLLTELGFASTCLKAPFGASGRNIMRLTKGTVQPDQVNRIAKLLKQQGGLIVEPWLARLADFSAHFHMEERLRFVGITRLLNDASGQYSGSVFGQFYHGLSKEVLTYIHEQGQNELTSYYKSLVTFLEGYIKDLGYQGPLGIDCFLYRGRHGLVSLRPVVEVNFRFTMGRVALALAQKLQRGKCGLLKIFSILSAREKQMAKDLVRLKNEQLVSNERGQWTRGTCMLNEWHERIKFPVLVTVGDNLGECNSNLSELNDRN